MICMTLGPAAICSDPGSQITKGIFVSDTQTCLSHLFSKYKLS